MSRFGKDSLLREIQTVDPNKIDKNTALRARNYLGQYSLEEVRLGSNGAAAFYVWVSWSYITTLTKQKSLFKIIRYKTITFVHS